MFEYIRRYLLSATASPTTFAYISPCLTPITFLTQILSEILNYRKPEKKLTSVAPQLGIIATSIYTKSKDSLQQLDFDRSVYMFAACYSYPI